MIQTVTGVAATVLTVAQVSLQLVSLWWAPSSRGVASSTWILANIQSLGLLIFSIHSRLLAAALTNAFVAVASFAILLLICFRTGVKIPLVISLAATAAVTFVWLTFGPDACGVLGSLAAVVVWIPQAAHSWRTRSPEGLTPLFVVAGVSSSVLWLVYGINAGKWELCVSPVTSLVSMLITIRMSRVLQ